MFVEEENAKVGGFFVSNFGTGLFNNINPVTGNSIFNTIIPNTITQSDVGSEMENYPIETSVSSGAITEVVPIKTETANPIMANHPIVASTPTNTGVVPPKVKVVHDLTIIEDDDIKPKPVEKTNSGLIWGGLGILGLLLYFGSKKKKK
jgi:LPXTG-motif cell wall-anchored protein